MHSVKNFLRDIAKQLISDIERGDSACHPGEKGGISESTAKKRLAEALPGFIDIGSGFIIDSQNSISKQNDLVIYEKNCPIFTLGDDNYKYYPCEGVCAVGEVKTRLNKHEIEDAYKKISSVKQLRRNPKKDAFRKYGSTQSSPNVGFDSDGKPVNYLDENRPEYQIFGFVLCRDLAIKPNTLMDHIIRLDKQYKCRDVPNFFVSLNNGLFFRAVKNGEHIRFCRNSNEANCVIHSNNDKIDNFPYLIDQLTTHIYEGNTTGDSPIKSYLQCFNNINITSIKMIEMT